MADIVKKVAESVTDQILKPAVGTVKRASVFFENDAYAKILILTMVTSFVVSGFYEELPGEYKQIIHSPLFRMLIIYINAFAITNDVKKSLMVTIALYTIYLLLQNSVFQNVYAKARSLVA